MTAYRSIHSKLKIIGVLACLVPTIILPYYCSIGGWVVKYFTVFFTGQSEAAAADGYFTNYITTVWEPIVWMIVFLGLTSFVVFCGVDKGIEKMSKILMPTLLVLVVGISIYSLTIRHTGDDGVVRTGLDGLKVYLVPDFTGMTLKDIWGVIVDAMGQLFFSISVSMGIMITYGSYVKKDVNLMKSINQIEIFDTVVAILAGMMIVPAVYTFIGTEGMSAGPGLMFVSLPKIFKAMGAVGKLIGLVFFLMVVFAAVTSAVSVMEAIVSSIMDAFHISRRKSTIYVTVYGLIGGILVCLGYNVCYFELKLPNQSVGQILDLLDYISNNCLMPLVALLTCILIGWVVKPKVVIDEVRRNGEKFYRRFLYVVMIKFVAPILLVVLLLQSLGV